MLMITRSASAMSRPARAPALVATARRRTRTRVRLLQPVRSVPLPPTLAPVRLRITTRRRRIHASVVAAGTIHAHDRLLLATAALRAPAPAVGLPAPVTAPALQAPAVGLPALRVTAPALQAPAVGLLPPPVTVPALRAQAVGLPAPVAK
jgi:hypothetical protein